MQTSSRLNGLLRSRGVFFFPEYEIHWYDGVGAAAMARKPGSTAAEAAKQWKVAEDAFSSYIRGAERSSMARTAPDRWIELAKVRHAAAKLEREHAEERRGKLPPASAKHDDETPL